MEKKKIIVSGVNVSVENKYIKFLYMKDELFFTLEEIDQIYNFAHSNINKNDNNR